MCKINENPVIFTVWKIVARQQMYIKTFLTVPEKYNLILFWYFFVDLKD